ncbi:hypothetical protein PAXINDRAFT_21812 [Paxillus involutus ATCC 200175]|uniref:Uncharacterized protein n=1 Tax=Paxillus involutus ATCC 200175 TaxID=664439 RepID=A0A0C9T9I1_PAXIN|nr:hypothetical protein PAXINDRAFT_21812 [Paxillus involutus ATCC 200175]
MLHLQASASYPYHRPKNLRASFTPTLLRFLTNYFSDDNMISVAVDVPPLFSLVHASIAGKIRRFTTMPCVNSA